MFRSDEITDMFRRLLLLPAIVASMAISGFAFEKQKPAAKAPRKPAALTDEEKEILKNREILENLELLKNFEKIQYLHFLSGKKTDESKEQPPAPQAGKDR
jgi:hypothetical protein